MLIDSHIHLHYSSTEEMHRNLQRAKEMGAQTFIVVSENAKSARRVVDVTEATDDMYGTVGIHPRHLHTYSPGDLDTFRELIGKSKKIVGIGECGLDYEGPLFGPHTTPDERDRQQQLFRDMIRLGREFGLPLNMHSDRPSHRDLLDILREEKAYEVGGLMHNFQGNVEVAKEYLDMGFYVSASVTIHHPLADRLRSVFREVSIGQIVMDSDSPLYKVPRVGDSQEPYPYDVDKVSEPRMVRYIADKIAELKEMPVEEVEMITSLNVRRLFNLPRIA